jgi:methylenetetrahydrofolate dehydrogenase (NADP+) / methenyltetrahydrofolate cyclohydrolase
MKLLNGSDIVDFVKPRQLHQARRLRQAKGVTPYLVIIAVSPNLASQTYIRYKQRYADDIEVTVKIIETTRDDVQEVINVCNADKNIHGIIVQLPIAIDDIEVLLNSIAPEKDVDGLGVQSIYDSATATAIQWLLAGYNIEPREKNAIILGNGRLVGGPLARLWEKSGYRFDVLEKGDDLMQLRKADLIVSATGVPGILKNELVPIGAIVIDAGVADVEGVIVGDADPSLYERSDLAITPKKGGVGPLTIAALFDNVLRAAEKAK